MGGSSSLGSARGSPLPSSTMTARSAETLRREGRGPLLCAYYGDPLFQRTVVGFLDSTAAVTKRNLPSRPRKRPET